MLIEFEKPLRRMLRADIRVDTYLPDTLGTVRADEGQLLQALTSLVANAQEAMPQGGVLTLTLADVSLGKMDLAAHPEVVPGPYVLLTVSDNGCGMDSAMQAHLFEPFFSTKGLGRGLGLAAPYGIVKQHGGHIWVASASGEGTTFSIYLPRVADVPGVPGSAWP
jgi:two-component system, cell cycle sensor histidine kinase and response regulator CckA